MVEPPTFIMIGKEATGKSTLLERLVSLPLFPRAEALCTRCAVQVCLRQTTELGAPATVRVLELKDFLDSPPGARVSSYDVDNLCMLSDDGMSSTCEAAVRAKMTKVLGSLAKSPREVSTDKMLQITVSHPSLPTLNLIDMPGLIGAENSSKAIRDLATRFIDKYRERDNAFFLAVVPNGESASGDLGFALLYENEVPYERIIGVFSKADRAIGDDPSKVPEDFVSQPGYPFKDHARLLTRFGWVATMNGVGSSKALTGLTSHVERLVAQAHAEHRFFQTMLRLKVDEAGELVPPAGLLEGGPLLASYGCNALVGKLNAAYVAFARKVWAPRLLLLLRGAWKRKRDGGAEVVAFKAGDKGRRIEIKGDEVMLDGEVRPVRWVGAHHFDLEGMIVSVDETKKGDVGVERGSGAERHIVFIGNPIAKIDAAVQSLASSSPEVDEALSLRDLGVPAAPRQLALDHSASGLAKRKELRHLAAAAAARALEATFSAKDENTALKSQKEAVSEFLHLNKDPLATDLHARVASLIIRQKRSPGPFDRFAVWFELQSIVADKVGDAASKFGAHVRQVLEQSEDAFKLARFPRFLDQIQEKCAAYYLEPHSFRGRSLHAILLAVAEEVPDVEWVESTCEKRAQLEAFIRDARAAEEKLITLMADGSAMPITYDQAAMDALSQEEYDKRDVCELADLQARGGDAFSSERVEEQAAQEGKLAPCFQLEELVAAGYPASLMRRAGCKLEALAEAGCSVHSLVQANFTISEIVELGHGETGATFSPEQWERAGFACRSLKEKKCSLSYLQRSGFDLKDLWDAGFTAREMRAHGFDAKKLTQVGASAAALGEAGFSAGELKAAGFTARALKGGGFTAKDLKDASYDVKQLKDARISARKLVELGYGLGELVEAELLMGELREAGFGPRDLRPFYSARAIKEDGEFTAEDLRAAGFTARLCYPAFSAQQLRKAGFPASHLRDAGCTVNELRSAGFVLRDLKEAGTSLEDLVRAGYSPKELDAAKFDFDSLSKFFRIADLIDGGIEPKGKVGFKGSHAEDLWRAGYDPTQLLKAGFREDHIRQIGFEEEHFRTPALSIRPSPPHAALPA